MMVICVRCLRFEKYKTVQFYIGVVCFALLTLKNSIKTIKLEQKQYLTKLVITIHYSRFNCISNISLRFNLANEKQNWN